MQQLQFKEAARAAAVCSEGTLARLWLLSEFAAAEAAAWVAGAAQATVIAYQQLHAAALPGPTAEGCVAVPVHVCPPPVTSSITRLAHISAVV